MRETRTSGSEGGGTDWSSLPLFRLMFRTRKNTEGQERQDQPQTLFSLSSCASC